MSFISRKLRQIKFPVDRQGFTLIELIVVFSVIGFLSTLGISSFVSYSRTQSVQTSYLDIMTVLNLAKSNSFNQVKPAQCESSGFKLDGYEFEPNQIDATYTINAICGGLKYSVKNGALAPNVTFGSGTSTNILFPTLTTQMQGGTVVIQGYNLSKTISVDSFGLVTGQDSFTSNVPSPTPTPTPTPGASNTPPPSSSSNPTPTSTPAQQQAIPTPTPSPTPRPTPTPTPSPTPVCINGNYTCIDNTVNNCLNNSYHPILPQCPTGTTCNATTFSCDSVGGGTLCGSVICRGTCVKFFIFPVCFQ